MSKQQKEPGFSYNKTHPENLQVSINKILGQPTSLRKIKKTKQDKQKALFIKIMDEINYVNNRSGMLDEEFEMDMTKYDMAFFDIIDRLIEYHFTPHQVTLINFFLYDRHNADGTTSLLISEEEEIIPLETIDELYNFLITLK